MHVLGSSFQKPRQHSSFFKTALLIGGGVLARAHSSRSKCLCSSFPHPLFSAILTRPLGYSFLEWCQDRPPLLSFVRHCCFPFYTHYLHGSSSPQNRLVAEAPGSDCQRLNPGCAETGASHFILCFLTCETEVTVLSAS